MEQQQAAVVFGNSEPKPNPKIWVKISYPEGYVGFKGWPEGTIKHYRKDAADLLIQKGIAAEIDAPEGVDTSTVIDTGEDITDQDTGEDETDESAKGKNRTGKNRKK